MKRGLNTGILQQLVKMRLISGREVIQVNKERKGRAGLLIDQEWRAAPPSTPIFGGTNGRLGGQLRIIWD